MCITAGKFLFFQELYRPFSPVFLIYSLRAASGRRDGKINIRRPKPKRTSLKLSPWSKKNPQPENRLFSGCGFYCTFRLVNICTIIFSCAYIIVSSNGTYSLKYTIKNLTSSKVDNLLISLRVSASFAFSSSSFRSENSMSSMLSSSLSPTETNQQGANVQTLLTYLWILVEL